MSISKSTIDLSAVKINYITQEVYSDFLLKGQINENELYITDLVTVNSGYTLGQIINRQISGDISGYANFIGSGAFMSNKITTATFSICIQICEQAFSNCYNLTSVNFPNCNYIGRGAFAYCSNLTSISFPNCNYIDGGAFYQCYSLTSISFSNCSYIGDNAFYSCYNLTSVNFPNCNYIGNNAFYYCYSLTSIGFPNCNYIGSYAFSRCFHLISFNLIGISSIPTLGINAFNSTPIGGYSASAGQYGSVYVPASLYLSFLTATNWSSISSRIISV